MLTTYLNDDIGLIMSSEIKACLGEVGGRQKFKECQENKLD